MYRILALIATLQLFSVSLSFQSFSTFLPSGRLACRRWRHKRIHNKNHEQLQHPPSPSPGTRFRKQCSSVVIHAARDGTASAAASKTSRRLSLSLTKPLGLILEEVVENQPRGVFVKEVSADASGSAHPYRQQIEGCRLSSVDGTDVTSLTFDTVMELLVNAPTTVQLQFLIRNGSDDDGTSEATELEVGTLVTLQVKASPTGDVVSIQGKVGDNLRQTLLQNNIEVYQGLKQNLGNCGGAGQCGFCAVDLLESDGWLERSDYEDKKLKKYPRARLSCLNPIQGPATMQKTQQ